MGLGQIVPAVRWCIPWQQRCRINALAILDNPAKDPYQVTVEVNIVQLAGLSQRGQDRSRLAAFFAADEQHIVAQQDGVLELALDGVVVEFNAAIFDEPGQAGPALVDISDGSPHIALFEILGFELAQSSSDSRQDWHRVPSSNSRPHERRLAADRFLDRIKLADKIDDFMGMRRFLRLDLIGEQPPNMRPAID